MPRELELTFDEENHLYYYGGELVPGVTTVIDGAGLVSDFCKDEWFAHRGAQVHKACALLAQGKLDWATVDPRIMGFVLSYQRFLESVTHWKLINVETRIYLERSRCAGTYDALFDYALIDLKTGGPAPWHAIQTAAYWLGALEARRSTKRATVYLREDGKIGRFVEHTSRIDLPTFLKHCEDYHANARRS